MYKKNSTIKHSGQHMQQKHRFTKCPCDETSQAHSLFRWLKLKITWCHFTLSLSNAWHGHASFVCSFKTKLRLYEASNYTSGLTQE